MTKEELIASSEKNIIVTYRRQPVVFVRGEGAHLWDTEGKEYVDFVAGIAVCSLGHSNPKVVEAICRQVGTLMHVSNLYYSEPQIRLAEMLVETSFADRVFFCISGAEANEAAIKVRGPMLFGGPFFDRHPFISGVLIALDPILDRLPLRFLLSSNLGMLCCKR